MSGFKYINIGIYNKYININEIKYKIIRFYHNFLFKKTFIYKCQKMRVYLPQCRLINGHTCVNIKFLLQNMMHYAYN